ncbi:hypothetical protein ACFXKD_07575 [Nocardiopsis aegyptia]|uniref:hypothetical protein n=1 Tax=Nocardiopsis TaxID=2013 RepID=UPI0006AE5683|nr:hypothetical protein [Nocardiopsis sp. NRRL B-16309]
MIGGKILTASALNAWAEGSVYMSALVGVAQRRVIPLHVPTLALAAGLHTVAPVRAAGVEERLDGPIFTFGHVDRDTAAAVARIATRWQDDGLTLADAHAVHEAMTRYAGWPIVTTSPAQEWERYLPDTPVETLP